MDLPLAADRAGPAPLTAQIAGQLRTAMTDGRLAAGERLPSTRALAGTLAVSRTVVTGAYAQLFAEGWIEGRHGSGTYVAGGASRTRSGGGPGGRAARVPAGRGHQAEDRAGPGGPLIELRPGIPWVAGIDRAAWRRAWRSAGAEAPAAAAEPQGDAALRAALTGYLRRSRAVRCAPGQIMVTRGVAGSLGLIAAALLRPGDRVGVEEPGYPTARAVFAAHGAHLVPCPVDADGLVVDALPAGLRLIYTTPAHQYPLGGRLPVPRRQALIAWARSTGALIVEDDYDGEFRYDVGPLPALFGLDPGVVVYLGTTTKILTPALRVGWLVAGPELVAILAETAARLGEWAGGPAQRAVLSLVASGDLERHIRRMRHEYARRRKAMTGVLGGGAGSAGTTGGAGTLGATGAAAAAGRLLGEDAGMHMVLQTGRDAEEIAAAAWERGVAVTTLARYFAGPVTVNGLVLGYGGASSTEITRACRILAGLATTGQAPVGARDGSPAQPLAHTNAMGHAGLVTGHRQGGPAQTGVRLMAGGGVPGVDDVAGLGRWLADNGIGGGDGPPEVRLIGGGRSNLTYRLDTGGTGPGRAPLVLRRPPLGHVLPTAHDMAREYRVLTALTGTAVPVPRPVAICQDPSVIGAPFYLMDYVDGAVLRAREDADVLTPAQAARLSGRFAEMLATIHGLDVRAAGLAGFGRPEGYLARQLDRWQRQWELSVTREMPGYDDLTHRLAAGLPAVSEAAPAGGLVHGDYRLDNMLVVPGDEPRIAAVVDWEMSTLGNPLADLGLALVYWTEPGEQGWLALGGTVTTAPGFATREQLAAQYARITGTDLSRISYYMAFGCFKLAVVLEGIHARFLQRKTVGEGFEREGKVVPVLIERAHQLLDDDGRRPAGPLP